MSLARFVERPLGVALALDQGGSGGTYAEACILISGVISGIASYLWPGDRIDRKRFVETWVRFSDPVANAVRVSVPLLAQSLVEAGRPDEAQTLRRSRSTMFGPGRDVRVVSGDEVDGDEKDLIALSGTLDLATVRRHSYPTIFYEHVRSKLVHEYGFGSDGRATGWPMTRRLDVGVSYANHLVKEEERPETIGNEQELVLRHYSVRRIHFHTVWLADLTTMIARNADQALTTMSAPLTRPASWWLPDRQPAP